MALKPTGPGLTLVLVSIILLSLSWMTLALRIYVRVRIRGFGLDDWLMCLGLAFYTVACVATTLAGFNGIGAHAARLTPSYAMEGVKWFTFFQFFYICSTVPIKASVCVTLIRIATRPLYQYILYTIIFLACVMGLTGTIGMLAWCQPVAATWNRSLGHCGAPDAPTNISYFISVVSIVTDWTCAILPAFILWEVQLRLRVKISVMIILAIGAIASTATVVRLKYLLNYTDPTDYLYKIAAIGTWSIAESGIGLIAGSLATFRPLLKHISFFGESAAGSGPSGATGGRSHKLSNLSHGKSLPSTLGGGGGSDEPNRNWEELSDAESQKFILKESHVVVTHDVTPERSEQTKAFPETSRFD